MMPGLLLPAALAALGALLIPLVIHIAQRTEQRILLFAALRWLEPNPRPRTQKRLDELLLLAVRLLLLALLAVTLAQPVVWNAQDRRPVIAVAPALGRDALPANAAQGRRAVWLAPGFAPVSAPVPTASASLASLLRQLDAQLPPGTPLEVLVNATLADADAERPRLSRAVHWRVLADRAPVPAKPAPPPPALVVRYAPEQADRARWFRAAAKAWATPGQDPALEADAITRPLPAVAKPVIWLAPGPAPAALVQWVRRGGTALLAHDAALEGEGAAMTVWQDSEGVPLITAQPLGTGRLLRLQRKLEPAAMPALLAPEFPWVLARLLQPKPPPKRVRAIDHAPVVTGAAGAEAPHLPLQAWFALAAALIFLLERWLATRPRLAFTP